MLAQHLISLSFCLEKATNQFCRHLSRFTCVPVAVEDILLVVDACRRARHLEPAADSSDPVGDLHPLLMFATPILSYPNFLVFSVQGSHALIIT